MGEYTSIGNSVIQAKVLLLVNGSPGYARFRMKKLSGYLEGGTAQLREVSKTGPVLMEWSYGKSLYTTSDKNFNFPKEFTSGLKKYCITVKGHNTSIYSGLIKIISINSAPSVTSVEPREVELNKTAEFTIYGQDLTSGMGFHIDDCDGKKELSGGTSTRRYWQCTPKYSAGNKYGVIKDKPDGTVLKEFTVSVTSSLPSVNLTAPDSGTFRVGQNVTIQWQSTNQHHYGLYLYKGSVEKGKITQPLVTVQPEVIHGQCRLR